MFNATAPSNFKSLKKKLTHGRVWFGWPILLLSIFSVAVFVVFTISSLLIHWNIGTSAFDLGIFDQAFWKYSRGTGTFNTVRGMSILGDHFSLIAFAFAPLYYIYPDVVWPLAFQALSVAVAGVLFYRVVEQTYPGKSWLALTFSLCYFLHPAVHNTLLWQYHEIVLASSLSDLSWKMPQKVAWQSKN